MNECVELTIFVLAFAISFVSGLGCGLNNNWNTDAFIVVKEVSLKEKHYEYETTKFNFESDSLYSVGDTLVIRQL